MTMIRQVTRTLCILAGAALLWSVPARGEQEPAQAQTMESSVARIKDSLKQESSRGNAVSAGLEEWRQSRPQESGAGMKMLQGLGFCLGVLLIGSAVARRLRGRSVGVQNGRLRVLERLALTPKTALLLVECDGRSMLLSVGPDHVAFQPAPAAYPLECGDAQEDLKLTA